MKLTITTNPWAPLAATAPLPERSTPESAWGAEESLTAWSPGTDAWALLARLRAFVGRKVVVQLGDPVVVMLDGEGPYPMAALCRDIVTHFDRAGRLCAFVVVQDVEVVRSVRGYDGRHQYLLVDGPRLLLSVGDLCEISTQDVCDGG